MVVVPFKGLQANGGEFCHCAAGISSVARHFVWVLVPLERGSGLGGGNDENGEGQ